VIGDPEGQSTVLSRSSDMARKRAAKQVARRNQALVRAIELIFGMQPGLLEAVTPLIADLAELSNVTLTAASLRRLPVRMFCVLRYQQLRRTPKYRHRSLARLVRIINGDAVRVDSSWKCSVRALQTWVRAWNATCDDGVAAGWRGLVRPYRVERRIRRGKRPRFGHSGRKVERSPEAIRFFRDRYVDSRGQTVAACHRATLEEARRQGWRWPETPESTRTWLKKSRREPRWRSLSKARQTPVA
jgi:hypothetical protein